MSHVLIPLKVHDRFKSLHRKLTKEEYKQLEANIVAEGGCHDPICVWRDFIIDGHNRYEICAEHDLTYPVERFDDRFPGEQAVVDWIIDLQLGRRNLTEQEMSYFRGKKLENAAAQPGKRTDRTSGQNDQRCAVEPTKTEVREMVAKQTGVSPETVKRDEKRAKQVDKLAATIKHPYLAGDLKLTDKHLAKLSEMPIGKQAELAREQRTSGRGWNEILGISSTKGGTDAAAKEGTTDGDSAAVGNTKDAGRSAESLEELAKKNKALAHQHRDKLARAICDYHNVKPNRKEKERLVKIVQGVSLW